MQSKQSYLQKTLTCHESHSKGQTNDSLVLEKLERHHWVASELPFPDTPCHQKRNADKKGAKSICRGPGVCVATGLQGDKAICEFSQSSARDDGPNQTLQNAQANDGKEAAHVVDSLQDLDLLETIASSVSVWEVEEGKAKKGNSVID